MSSFKQWFSSGFASPAPSVVKRAVVRRNSLHDGTFVETGTFFGDTSASAAKYSKAVVTIEPAKTLYDAAVARFAHMPAVSVINGSSEDVFPQLLPTLDGPVTFWLDGHYSGGVTHLGSSLTPLAAELECLSQHIDRFHPLVVMVDDIRALFGSPDYPSIAFVLGWADRHKMTWHIEHDILVMVKD
ncbi:hypothetical protein [Devosia alba]|uniref:hypothetical protein n=1 Tax=Devosia alba TaxID=3152360 RepID=UPI00326364DA